MRCEGTVPGNRLAVRHPSQASRGYSRNCWAGRFMFRPSRTPKRVLGKNFANGSTRFPPRTRPGVRLCDLNGATGALRRSRHPRQSPSKNCASGRVDHTRNLQSGPASSGRRPAEPRPVLDSRRQGRNVFPWSDATRIRARYHRPRPIETCRAHAGCGWSRTVGENSRSCRSSRSSWLSAQSRHRSCPGAIPYAQGVNSDDAR